MAAYYREATVYTSFATTALGLFAMGVITSMDCYKKRKRRGRARDAIIPPGVGQIQSGTGKYPKQCCVISMYVSIHMLYYCHTHLYSTMKNRDYDTSILNCNISKVMHAR